MCRSHSLSRLSKEANLKQDLICWLNTIFEVKTKLASVRPGLRTKMRESLENPLELYVQDKRSADDGYLR